MPVVGAPFKVTFEGGTVRQGTLDAHGYALLTAVPNKPYVVEYGEDARPWKSPAFPSFEATRGQGMRLGTPCPAPTYEGLR